VCASQADGSDFTETEILDFLRNFLIAGRDTTAELLTWTVYMLSQNPDVEAHVLSEIASVIGDAPLTYENVNQLKYLKAVLQEVLRLYPPGMMRVFERLREEVIQVCAILASVPVDGYNVIAEEGDVLPGDYWVPKNAAVLYSAYVMHRLPEYFPEPERFNPDRFLTGDPPKPFTYLPFHGGPRLCLGMDMAYLEARVALVVLLRKYRFVPHEGFVPQVRTKIILTAGNGMMMDLLPR
jgi:cytochrome P450